MISTISERRQPESVAFPADTWPLRGGASCLDFANTVAWRSTPRAVDALGSYDDLVAWSRHAGLLSAQRADRLRAHAARDEAGGSAALQRALALREAIDRLFNALAHGADAGADELATLNAVLAEGAAHSAVTPGEAGFVVRYQESDDALALPLWLLAESAARLLLSGEWRRVRACPGHDCGWLFLDQTRNGNRRWCDSADCGNRARVRAHYQRRRQRRRAD